MKTLMYLSISISSISLAIFGSICLSNISKSVSSIEESAHAIHITFDSLNNIGRATKSAASISTAVMLLDEEIISPSEAQSIIFNSKKTLEEALEKIDPSLLEMSESVFESLMMDALLGY